MENLTAQLSEHAHEIDAALWTVEQTRPEFYQFVCETPNLESVTKLLRGIVDDPEQIELITKYLTFIK